MTGITSSVSSAIPTRQPLRYAGYAYDAHSATYYLSARHYDPATMRFLTKDPARDDGEESAYQYCAGDPVGKVDPTGLYAMPTRKRQFRLSTARAWPLRALGRVIRRSYLEVTERLRSRIDPVAARVDYKVDVVVCAADAVSAIPKLRLGSGIARRVLGTALRASAKKTGRKTLERTYWRFPYHGWIQDWRPVRWPASQGNRGPILER